jgi:hypothetical protein
LNLKRKVVLKRSLKKKKRENLTFSPFGPSGPAAHQLFTRASPRRLFLFPFCFLSLTCGPHLAASPLPFLSSSSPRRPADPAPLQISPRPAASPSFPF